MLRKIYRQNYYLNKKQRQIQRITWAHVFWLHTTWISGCKDRLACLWLLEIVKKEIYSSKYYK